VTESAPCNETTTPPPDGGRRQLVAALLLTAFAFLVYNANLRLISSGDNYPARYLPFSILKHGRLSLETLADATAQGDAHPYWLRKKDGRVFSSFPVAVPVLVTPLYVPAALHLHCYGWTDNRLDRAARVMEKLTSALIASLSVGLMYLLLVQRTRCRLPLLLTIAYGFGANTWMISSQALWQHGLAELLLTLALFILLGRCTAPRSLAVGACLALAACARPPDAIFAAALGLFALRWSRGAVRFLLVGGAVPFVLLLTYNYHVARTIVGGYGSGAGFNLFNCSLGWGLLGLLFSPTRGLFVFSPFLLFLPLGLRSTLREPRLRPLALLVLGGVLAQLALYAKLDWRAGCAWGPRWLTDMLPLLVWLLAPAVGRLGRIGTAVFVLTIGASIGVQGIGAFWYTGASDEVIMREAGDPSSLSVTWDFYHAPFVAELRHDPAPRDLLLEANGFVDLVKAEGVAVDQITPGVDLEVFGWALADRRTPTAVRVTLAPTKFTPWKRSWQCPLAETTVFGERPDVTQTMQAKGPAAWRVVLKTEGLKPGPYRFEVKAQGDPGGEFRPVAHRPFLILPPPGDAAGTRAGLESLYHVARDRLRGRQHADGYWLTTHTGAMLEGRRQEMCVFVTAMVVDLIDPTAGAAGLEENVVRARRHLRQEIEPRGLVRYHGRPDGPTIPSLGCVITPDADDTALVWRIVGSNGDVRFGAALDVLKKYQTPEGLYRTWLAPREEYISIDVGRDPNPIDVGIQMHVLMLLAQADPPAAKSLQQALQATIGEDRLWVWYKLAPLLPIWREGELYALGYPVKVPPERVRTAFPEQEVWVAACRLLARYAAKTEPRPTAAETHAILESLGKDNFAAVRSNPPFLYHNDVTSKCARHYWSEDFGYALWLRLYLESSRSLGWFPFGDTAVGHVDAR
jgi:hypothetical protein